MYYPILRGKRFELLALREWSASTQVDTRISPIIEPVRAGTLQSDLRRAAAALASARIRFGVVVNPMVGDITGDTGPTLVVEEIAAWDANVRELASVVVLCRDFGSQGTALEATARVPAVASLPVVPLLVEDFEVKKIWNSQSTNRVDVLIGPNARTLRRIAASTTPQPGVAKLSDPFPLAQRNADYAGRGEVIFTDDHLYFAEEGQVGFADYMTIGSDFRDGGGSPNFVAIHWTYSKVEPRADGYPVYLQHFCSSQKELDFDVASKFRAATESLLAFASTNGIRRTAALDALAQYHSQGAFPGLGVLKKLSLLNHLEVMDTTPWTS